MASTEIGARLTEVHRLAQLRLGAQTVQQMSNIWPLLDTNDLDGSVARWLRVAQPLVQAQRASSSSLASGYLSAFRSVELGSLEPFVPTLAASADTQALVTSLTVTGPYQLKAALARGVPVAQAAAVAERTSAAAAMRHAMAGGRDTISNTIENDKRALGFARVTSGKACAFCAMLASRGPVYKADTVGFRAHDGCTCSSEPVYHRDAAWPARSRQYKELWEESTRGRSGRDAINAFRKALDESAIADGVPVVPTAPPTPAVPARLSTSQRETLRQPYRQWGTGAHNKEARAALNATPEGKALVKAVDQFQSTQGGVARYRKAIDDVIQGVTDMPAATREHAEAMLDALRTTPADGKTLYRGMSVKRDVDSLLADYETGSTVDLGLSSFSSNQKVANHFMSFGSTGKTQISITLEPPDQALPLSNISKSKHAADLREYVAGGRFEVISARKTGPRKIALTLRQVAGL